MNLYAFAQMVSLWPPSRILLAAAILFNVASALSDSQLFVLEPASLVKSEGYSHQDALFGATQFDGGIQQNVYYVDDFAFCSFDLPGGSLQDTPDTVYPQKPAAGESFILMIDRGDCTFVKKVRHAQQLGATAVLIADNTCLCGDADCPGKDICQSLEPILADDGSGSDITIPTFMLRKTDADAMKVEMKAGKTLQVEMKWDIPLGKSEDIVDYELWFSLGDPTVASFLAEFGAVAEALNTSAHCTPRHHLFDGVKSGCTAHSGEQVCYNLCTNNGRYCQTDPDNDLDHGISGQQLIVESLRRECIWMKYGDDGIGIAWWKYVEYFHDYCSSADMFDDGHCINSAMETASINPNVINRCMADSGGTEGDQDNSILQNLIADANTKGIVLLPTLLVDGVTVRGSLSPESALEAICAGFTDGSDIPDVCASCATCTKNFQQCVQDMECTTVAPTLAPIKGDNHYNIDNDNNNQVNPPMAPGIPFPMDVMQPFFDVTSSCGMDLEEYLEPAVSAVSAMDTDGAADVAESIFGPVKELCAEEGESAFHKAFDDFQTCSGVDLFGFLEEFPSDMVGTALRCMAYISPSDEINNWDSLPEECIDAVLGENPMGNVLRALLVKPGAICECLPAFHDALPECTLDAWPIPLVGKWSRSTSCLVNLGCTLLPTACNTFMTSLDLCLPLLTDQWHEDSCDNVKATCFGLGEVSAAFLDLPSPLCGMPIPDICQKEDPESLSNLNYEALMGRYKNFQTHCTSQWTGWEYSYQQEKATGVKPVEPIAIHESLGGFAGGFAVASILAGLLFGLSRWTPRWIAAKREKSYQVVATERSDESRDSSAEML